MQVAEELYRLIDAETRANLHYTVSKGLKTRLAKRFGSLKNKAKFYDVEFIVGQERQVIPAVRVVFGTLSDWFENRLYGEQKTDQVELPEITPLAFESIANLAYGEDPNITIEHVMEILHAANHVGFGALSGECLGLLAGTITEANVMAIFSASLSHGILTHNLEKQCCKVILRSSETVLMTDGFLNCNVELMSKIVESDYFFVNERKLWNRLIQWARVKALTTDSEETKNDETPMGPPDETTSEYQTGDKVKLVDQRVGVIKYVGKVHFKPGLWYGIELNGENSGSSSGTIEGRQYFETTTTNSATFVRGKKIEMKIIEEEAKVEENTVPTCSCGIPLTRMPATEAYGGGGVNCDLCSRALTVADEEVFHCQQGRIEAHSGGYDVCINCSDNGVVAEQKETDLEAAPLDIQYLRQIIPFVRFPLFEPEYFVERIAPILPREMADSVLIHRIIPERQCLFPVAARVEWGVASGDSLTFTVIAASHEIAKAKKIPGDGDAAWSGTRMRDSGNKQWFVIDTQQPCKLTKCDIRNHYGDGDTIKDCVLEVLPADLEWQDSYAAGTNWVQQCTFQSEKTSSWQRNIAWSTSQFGRYFRFVVNNVWGGEGNYTCVNAVNIYGTISEDGWTTGFCDPENED